MINKITEYLSIIIGLSIFGYGAFAFITAGGIVNILFGLLLAIIFCMGLSFSIIREILHYCKNSTKKDDQ